MNRVFADTFYLLALLNRHDPAHEEALEFYGNPSIYMVATEWVLTEVADAMADPAARHNFKKLFDVLGNDSQVKEKKTGPSSSLTETAPDRGGS